MNDDKPHRIIHARVAREDTDGYKALKFLAQVLDIVNIIDDRVSAIERAVNDMANDQQRLQDDVAALVNTNQAADGQEPQITAIPLSTVTQQSADLRGTPQEAMQSASSNATNTAPPVEPDPTAVNIPTPPPPAPTTTDDPAP